MRDDEDRDLLLPADDEPDGDAEESRERRSAEESLEGLGADFEEPTAGGAADAAEYESLDEDDEGSPRTPPDEEPADSDDLPVHETEDPDADRTAGEVSKGAPDDLSAETALVARATSQVAAPRAAELPGVAQATIIPESSLRDFCYAFFRRRTSALLFALGIFLLIGAVTFLRPQNFRSEAKLLVQLGRESVSLDPTVTTGDIILPVTESRKSQIQSELEILRSQDIATAVVESIGPRRFLGRATGLASLLRRSQEQSARDRAVLVLMKQLAVEMVENSHIIGVSYLAPEATLAQEVVTQVIRHYLAKHIAVHQAAGSYDFFAEQSDLIKDQLEDIEDRLLELKNATGITSQEEQRFLMLDRIATLEKAINQARADLAATDARIGALRDGSARVPDARATLLTEQASRAALAAKIETLTQQKAEAEVELRALETDGLQITRLAREMSIQEASYRKYAENMEQARIDDELERADISNISIVQPATLPVRPAGMPRVLGLLLGVLLALCGGAGFVLLAEYTDHSIKTPEQAENLLGTPTLATVPEVSREQVLPVRESVKPSMAAASGADEAGALDVEGASGARWVTPELLREHYEDLAARLLLWGGRRGREAKIIAVTGCRRGQGVSTVTAHLATTLARPRSGRVLLIDAAVTHPTAHRLFEMELSPGLADLLLNGSAEAAEIALEPGHLDVIPAGQSNGPLAEIFDAERLGELLGAARRDYRFVLIDAPPMAEASSVLPLLRLCDGVILVVEAERLRWEVAYRARQQLARAEAQLLGLVLNKRRLHIPGWLYERL